MNKTLLLIYPGGKRKELTLKRLAELGYSVITVAEEKEGWFSSLSTEVIVANFNQPLAEAERLLKNKNVKNADGALTFSDEGILLRDALVTKGGFIGTNYETSLAIKNKLSFRKMCEDSGLFVPTNTRITSKDQLDALDIKTLPWIIKPIMGLGSRAVKKINTTSELSDFLEEVDWQKYPEFMIEEYLPGDEVDVDLIVQDGQIKFASVSDNYNWKEPYFIQLAGNMPSNLNTKTQERLLKLSKNVVEICGIQNACLHLEAMATEEQTYAIELNVRMGGAETHTFNLGVYGVDLIEASASLATGAQIADIPTTQARCSMRARAFMPYKSGILKAINFGQEVSKKTYLDVFEFYPVVGDNILGPPDGFALLGWFTVKAKNDEQALKYVDEVLDLCEYEVE